MRKQFKLRRLIAAMFGVGLFAVAAPAAMATTPGQNGKIVFSSDASGSNQLYVVRPDGTGLHQITHVDGDAVNPDWSPDGRRIVFEWDLPNDAGAAFAIVRPDGGDLHTLPSTTPAGGFSGQPSFLPNGKRILFERYDGTTNDAIFASRLDGSGLSRVTEGFPNGDTDPNSSPSGERISFVRYHNGVEFQQALVVSNLDGNHLVRLTPYSFDVGIKQDWSPDGGRLVFTRDANPFPNTSAPDANVATIRRDGSGLRMLTHFSDGRFNAFAGSYSPDGRWIVFRLEDNVTGMSGLWRMHTDGTHRRLIFSIPDFRPRYIDWGSRVTSDD